MTCSCGGKSLSRDPELGGKRIELPNKREQKIRPQRFNLWLCLVLMCSDANKTYFLVLKISQRNGRKGRDGKHGRPEVDVWISVFEHLWFRLARLRDLLFKQTHTYTDTHAHTRVHVHNIHSSMDSEQTAETLCQLKKGPVLTLTEVDTTPERKDAAPKR